MPTQAKIDTVQEIKQYLDGSEAMWLVDYRGLSVKKTEALRRALRDTGAEMKVYKNKLIEIALRDLDYPEMSDYLNGPNGFVFVSGDIAASAKAIKTFAKKNKELEIRGGLVNGQVMTAEQVMAIAELPSREELIAKLLGTMNNPMSQIVRVLNEPMASFARTLAAIASEKQAA
ncbi:MAG: 50S ribosomal protein L10 [Actinobacteria bacterium]|nr:50S ribosomal protein L10 [Actinomycetota bacterium]